MKDRPLGLIDIDEAAVLREIVSFGEMGATGAELWLKFEAKWGPMMLMSVLGRLIERGLIVWPADREQRRFYITDDGMEAFQIHKDMPF